MPNLILRWLFEELKLTETIYLEIIDFSERAYGIATSTSGSIALGVDIDLMLKYIQDIEPSVLQTTWIKEEEIMVYAFSRFSIMRPNLLMRLKRNTCHMKLLSVNMSILN